MNDSSEPTSALTVRNQQTLAVGPVSQAMAVEEILAQVGLIQQVMGKVMIEGEHYGKIPGCGDKKTLLQPGAQKLTMTFRLAPEYQIQETNFDRGHKEYRVICTLRSIGSGAPVGQGVGCCSTLEGKYRWKAGTRKCPECGKETIIKGKSEYGGGWLCFAKKGGCGQKWADGAPEIEGQSVERQEHDSPADFYNTVLKMAKKRAFVDATITATAASDIFTQDIGDPEADNGEEEPKKPAPKPVQPAKPSAAAPKPAPKATAEALNAFQERCKAKLVSKAQSNPYWQRYAVERGWILPNEPIEAILGNVTPVFIIDYNKDMDGNSANVAEQFASHERAVLAMVEDDEPVSIAGTKDASAKGCPNCGHKAVVMSKEFDGVLLCQACAWQWDIQTGDYFEEHEWQKAVCPIPPKGMPKKQYDDQPMTLGQISRQDSKRFYGLVMNNQEAKMWRDRGGKDRPPSCADEDFADACKAAVLHMEQSKRGLETHPDNDGDLPPF